MDLSDVGRSIKETGINARFSMSDFHLPGFCLSKIAWLNCKVGLTKFLDVQKNVIRWQLPCSITFLFNWYGQILNRYLVVRQKSNFINEYW